MWSDEIEPVLLGELVEAWTCRQMWQADLQAALIVRTLSKSLDGAKQNRVSDVELLGQMGIAL